MTTKERVAADLSNAMKRKDASVVDTLRMFRAAEKNAEIAKGRVLDEAETVAVIRGMIKQQRDAIGDFRAGARQDLVDRAEAEIKVLSVYLPAEISDDELEAAVAKLIAETGAVGPNEMGRVMAAAGELKTRVDGGRLAAAVKAQLADK
jgi:uncharacterized protein YqeY